MFSEIKKHHKKAIENLIKEYENDNRFPALIIGGSVAKKSARDDSDVDFIIIANEEEFNKRKHKGELFINRTDLCNYPGGYVDGKIININFLHNLSKNGNEPSRAAFDGAYIAYSKLPNLEKILKKIPVYPEKDRVKRMKSFYSMAFIQNWLMDEATRNGDIYTKTRAISQLALYSGRLILAYNRILFPYHKWLLRYIDKCPEKPKNFINNLKSLLNKPTLKKANNIFQSLKDFRDWGVTDHEAYLWFMTNIEWSWMRKNTPLEDL